MARGIETKEGHTFLWTDTPTGRLHLNADKVVIRASDARVFIADGPGLRHLSPDEYDMAGLLPMVEKHGVLKVGA